MRIRVILAVLFATLLCSCSYKSGNQYGEGQSPRPTFTGAPPSADSLLTPPTEFNKEKDCGRSYDANMRVASGTYEQYWLKHQQYEISCSIAPVGPSNQGGYGSGGYVSPPDQWAHP